MFQPKLSYARNGDVNIAYQVIGEGPLDLLFIPPFISHLDLYWASPDIAAFLRRLASFSRLILFDKRGTGLSDPVAEVGTLEDRMEDARAVLGRDAIIGQSTHSEEEIAAAQGRDIDYFAVGPVWETPTKPGRPAVGLELVTHAAEVATKPFFAIGGIGPLNAAQVIEAGARRLCVVRAIRDAPHPEVAAEALRRSFEAEGSNRGVAPGG